MTSRRACSWPTPSIANQFTDAAAAHARCRRRVDADYPKRIPGQEQGSQLAARAKGTILHNHATLLAEGRSDGRQVDKTAVAASGVKAEMHAADDRLAFA